MNGDFIILPGLAVIWFIIGLICGRIKSSELTSEAKV